MIDGERRAELELTTVIGSVVGKAPCSESGEFRYSTAERRWEWSDDLARMFGYEPGAVEPSTELLLSHQHPDDRADVSAVIDRVVAGEPFCSRHRIIDTAGEVHEVIVIGDYDTDDAGAVIGTSGYYIDLTDALEEERSDALDTVLPEVIASRAPIEQAKGVLALIYGLSSDQAFAVLKWRSQHTNTKLQALATRLVEEARRFDPNGAAARTRFDHVLLTVHELVGEPPAAAPGPRA
ncbi:PAS and ANTAR domain-containing protein [Nocardia blacklockiae]|uniref:PAS and ANTAR domain-containing protein n=1 Tax=Nocardia blacklockiae TaxID=480036 RepID=UPI0018948A89|nr:PAS and ANTAR domain-containing protein [Nocardia blacklockiae]MBF6170978.1 ANTAR domain-containing protein [Nocardia blacklockiae]